MPKKKLVDSGSSTDSDSGPDDKNPVPAKKSKDDNNKNRKSSSSSTSKSEANKKQWTLEKLRQVNISEFRGRKMVDIREFYEKNGEILPGKKGISLSITQWKKLVEIVDEVNQALED